MVTCRLTACTPGSALGPTLGIEYGKPLPLPFSASLSVLLLLQECSMKFGSWTNDGFRLDIDFYAGNDSVDVSDYIKSNEWALVGHPAVKSGTRPSRTSSTTRAAKSRTRTSRSPSDSSASPSSTTTYSSCRASCCPFSRSSSSGFHPSRRRR